MSNIELKPCPFCGGEATIRTRIRNCTPPYQIAWVECEKCGATGSTFSDTDDNGSHIFSAIEAWNRRIPE